MEAGADDARKLLKFGIFLDVLPVTIVLDGIRPLSGLLTPIFAAAPALCHAHGAMLS